MTKIKLCGLSRMEDIETANRLRPDYIGFVFAEKSRRYVSPEQAAALKEKLDPEIRAVGVFVNEDVNTVSELLQKRIIDMAQLHGAEDDAYITCLKERTGKPVIRAFQIRSEKDLEAARTSPADEILLDSGAGGGEVLNWELLRNWNRPFFLAGGLNADNVKEAIRIVRPFAVDVSSGIETRGVKDPVKMAAFVRAVRDIQ